MCFNRECGSYRKSIRRADIESRFERLLGELQPAPSLIRNIKAMFADAWAIQRRQARQAFDAHKRAIAKTDEEISRLLDCIVTATNDSVIAAYEKRIDALEREKLVHAERHAKSGEPQRSFEEMFELAMSIIASPSNLWKSDRIEDKQTVIKLVFADRLRYSRFEGFRPRNSPVFSKHWRARKGEIV